MKNLLKYTKISWQRNSFLNTRDVVRLAVGNRMKEEEGERGKEEGKGGGKRGERKEERKEE